MIMDSAVKAMRKAAAREGGTSLLTFTPEGHALILIGCDEEQVVEVMTDAIARIETKRAGGNHGTSSR